MYNYNYNREWPKFEVGGSNYDSGKKLLREIRLPGVYHEPIIETILNDPDYKACKSPKLYHLCTKAPRDLGFTGLVYKPEFYSRAEKDGLYLVHSDTPIILRIRYKDQLEKQDIHAAMEPLNVGGREIIFTLTVTCGQNGTMLWIRVIDTKWNAKLKPDDEFLFCKQ